MYISEVDDCESVQAVDFDKNDTVHVSDRDDASTVLKTKELGDLIIRPLPTPIDDLLSKVTRPVTPGPKEQLLSMDPEALQSIEAKFTEALENPPEGNYMIRLQTLIATLLEQLVKISDKERTNKEEQKKQFKAFNKEWGVMQKELGARGLHFTGIALGLMALQILSPGDHDILNFLADKGCTNLSNMFNGETQSRQKMIDGLASLASTELNSLINKQDQSGSKQELTALLEKAFSSLQQAARS